MRVLDAACGMGYGTHLIAEMRCHAIGGDVSNDALDYARSHYGNANAEFIKIDCRKLELPDKAFNAYISFETIEHFLEQDEYLAEARRVLAKDGVFICSTPNKDIHDQNRKKGWQGSNPYHLKELTLKEFRELLYTHFDSVELYGQDYDPLALRVRELTRLLSEVRWEMDNLPVTILKKMIPVSIYKACKKKTNAALPIQSNYTLDMIKFSKTNIDNADTIVAICRA
jgi:SAM-dependent methyltransferase